MNLRRSSRDDRGVSVVIGTVLLIGMVTMAMAVLGAAVLSTDLVDSPPRADFVYQEDSSGTVAIGLTDVQRLTAGGTEIKLEGEGSCGMWDGSGDLEEGDITTVDGSDCPDSLDEGDVLQMIGDQTLLDTYQIRGMGPTVITNCGGVATGSDVDIGTGKTYECEFTDPSEDRNFDIYNGSTLVGNISTSDGDFDLDDAEVDGYVEAGGDDVTVTGGSAMGDFIYIDGNIDIDGSSTIDGPVLATGDIDIDGSTIDGKIYTLDEDDNVETSGASHDGIEELANESEMEAKADEFK